MNNFNFLRVCLLFYLSYSYDAKDEPVYEDYCIKDFFQPRCQKNEVVLMKSAILGRMRIGRCLTAEEVETLQGNRYFGCSTDVLSILDGRCSAENECEVRIVDISSENVKPCFPGLSVYLEASYECIGVVDEKPSCAVDVSINPIHIISSKTCGSKTRPWIVEAPVGQKVKIGLIDLTNSHLGQTVVQQQSCQSQGVIVDKAGKMNKSICIGGREREMDLYQSAGNGVEILLNLNGQQELSGANKKYIVKLEAVGCSDIFPPEDAYLKRKGDLIMITCYSSRKTWHLNCVDGRWIGVVGNCSQGNSVFEPLAESGIRTTTWSNEQVLVVMALCGFTLAICLAIVCLGAICLRRFSLKKNKKQDYKTLDYQINSDTRHQLPHQCHLQSGLTSNFTGNNTDCFVLPPQAPTYSVYVGESEYAADAETTSIPTIHLSRCN